jgi:hypothetical protein
MGDGHSKALHWSSHDSIMGMLTKMASGVSPPTRLLASGDKHPSKDDIEATDMDGSLSPHKNYHL